MSDEPVPSRPLVLFDVDGTLVLGASRLHLIAMREAFTAVFGVTPGLNTGADGVPRAGRRSLAGMIDREVFAAAAEDAGVPAGELTRGYEPLLAEFVTRYRRMLADDADPGTPIPGARETLAELRAAGARLGLLTGNAHQVAEAKLTAVGLAAFFDFDVAGGFGAYAADRAALVPAALAFAARTAPVEVAATALVGDTPTDVAAALRHGVHPVALATGVADRATLSRAGAHLVLDDLREAAPAILALLGCSEGAGATGR